MLIHQYKEMGDWLRMLKGAKKWRPVQHAYDKAYKAARSNGKSLKHAHLQAKCTVLNLFPWVNERDLGRDRKRGIIPYD